MGFLRTIFQICGCALALLLGVVNGMAQRRELVFEAISPDSEIGQRTVSGMLQDRHGYIWLATWSGLWRYDAYSFRQFGNESGLKSSKITDVFEEKDGTIWAATRNNGLYRFNQGTEMFDPVAEVLPAQQPLQAQNITSVFRDRSGRYWIGAEEGLSMYDPARQTFTAVALPGVTPPPSENIYLYSICQTDDGSIWVGGSHGLYYLPGTASTVEFRQVVMHPDGVSPQKVEFHNFLYRVQPVKGNASALWVCSKHGLKWLDFSGDFLQNNRPAPGKVTYFEYESGNAASLTHNFVTDICASNYPAPGALWVSTFNGLNLLLPTNGEITANAYKKGQYLRIFAKDGAGGLQSNNIASLFCDRSGLVWIGTDRGLNKLDPRFSNFDLFRLRRPAQLADESVSFLSRTAQNVWVSAFGGGIFRIPLLNGQPQWSAARHHTLSAPDQSPVTGFISAILPDKEGYIWVLTQGAGVFRFREKDAPAAGGAIPNTIIFDKGNTATSLSDNYIMSGVLRKDGQIWFGCWDAGINLYRPDNGGKMLRFTTTTDQQVDFHLLPVVALAETEENGVAYLWAGTRGGGLFQLAFDETNESLSLVRRWHREAGTARDQINGNFITSVQTDRDGNLWVTAENALLVKKKGQNEFQSTMPPDFPPALHYEAVVQDANGRYWISTGNGVGLFNGQSIPEAVFFTNRNGLRERSFNSGAAIQLENGTILFGGINGITHFQPEQIQLDTFLPVPVITGLRLFNKAVVPGQRTEEGFLLEKSLAALPKLVLTHRDNVVSFEFSGLHYSYAEHHRFAYKLEGFDPGWIYTDAAHRLAHYTNLPAGTYTFLVKTANADGFWNPEPARLVVKVLPPFWRSWWAYLLYIAVAFGLIWAAIRVLLMRADYENKIKIERLEKEKLEEVNQMKLIFFTNISHELKTPLTLIISPLEEIIRNRTAGNSALQATFSMMHRNAVRLLTMINQLLDIRKAEAGLMHMERQPGNIVQFVGEIYLSFRELAHQRKIQFEISTHHTQINALYDADQLEKVFFNILSNAFKFTPPGGKVAVSMGTDTDQKRYFVRVEDNGKGIPADKLPFIFERYFRADEQTNMEAEDGGTGIGLSLVKHIVELHDGSIDVESTPGKGSVFTVWLPLPPAVTAIEEVPDWSEDASSFAPAEVLPEWSTTPAPALGPETVVKPQLLVIEDNADIREYLAAHLAEEYDVEMAENGEQGLEKVLKLVPDLVICDISMPGMDGIELTRQVKSRVEISHIPVILLTARTALIFKMDGLESGADDYITKPFNLSLLQLRIRNLIESRRVLREKFAKGLQRFDPTPSDVLLPDLDQEFLAKTTQIVEENIENPDFSIDDLARKLLMNRKQVYRKIKALTDSTPVEFIRVIRLKRAAALLRSHQFTISEITYKVGFQDLKYFRERFRAFFGVNPSDMMEE